MCKVCDHLQVCSCTLVGLCCAKCAPLQVCSCALVGLCSATFPWLAGVKHGWSDGAMASVCHPVLLARGGGLALACAVAPPASPSVPQAVGKTCGIWVVPIVGGISALKQERLLSKHPEVSNGCGRLSACASASCCGLVWF